MAHLRRYRPSAATVIACIALLVALGGTSFAAVALAPNTVGTAQLKNNAVVSSKVKNGSLLRADFKAGQLPAGPAGPAGTAGPAGASGPSGPPGPAGAGAKWALIDKTGNVVAQSGGISVTSAAGGSFFLDFGSSLTGKTLQATRAYRDDDTTFAAGVTVAMCGGVPLGATCTATGTNDVNHLLVRTSNAAGTAGEAHAFYVAAF